jgi:hypothetical protein
MATLAEQSELFSSQRLSSDVVFRVLSNRRRRYVVHYLLQRQEAVEFRRLTEQVTAWENGIPVEAVTHDQRKRVYTALRQTHLPTMADAGVIDYDRQRGIVEPTESVAEFEIYLDIVASRNVPWSTFYLGLGLLAVGLSALVVIDLPPFGLILDSYWSLFVGTCLVASSAVHIYMDRNHRLGSEGPPPELDVANDRETGGSGRESVPAGSGTAHEGANDE